MASVTTVKGIGFGESAIACTFALGALFATATSVQPASPSLCATGETIHFEAGLAGSEGSIAVCSTPNDGDKIGTIRVLRSEGTAGKADPAVLASASGDRRAAVFTIRRYTRPRTTYLKFSFMTDRDEVVLYDADDNGQRSVHMKETPRTGPAAPRETDLIPRSEPLSLMLLESVVKSLPFDE